jgi:hypothetical protein
MQNKPPSARARVAAASLDDGVPSIVALPFFLLFLPAAGLVCALTKLAGLISIHG